MSSIFPTDTESKIKVPVFPLTKLKYFLTKRSISSTLSSDVFFIYLDTYNAQNYLDLSTANLEVGQFVIIITSDKHNYLSGSTVFNYDQFTGLPTNSLILLEKLSMGWRIDLVLPVADFYPNINPLRVTDVTDDKVNITTHIPVSRTVNIDMHELPEPHLFVVYDSCGLATSRPVTCNFDKPCSGQPTITLVTDNSYIIVLYTPNLGYELIGTSSSNAIAETIIIRGMLEWRDLTSTDEHPLTKGLADISDTSTGGYFSSLTGA